MHSNDQEVILKLYRSRNAEREVIVTGAKPTWNENTYTFSNLEKYDVQGYLYTYRVEEVPATGYTSVQNGNDFTNTLNDDAGVKIVITPENAEKIYGEADPTEFNSSVTWPDTLPAGIKAEDFEVTYDVTRQVSTSTDYETYFKETEFVGSYDITVSNVTIVRKSNSADVTKFFDISTGTATFTINQRPLTIILGEKEATLAELDVLPGRKLVLDPATDVTFANLAKADVIRLQYNDTLDNNKDEVTSISILAALYTVGEMPVTKDHVKDLVIMRNPEVTGNYYIDVVNGKLKVTDVPEQPEEPEVPEEPEDPIDPEEPEDPTDPTPDPTEPTPTPDPAPTPAGGGDPAPADPAPAPAPAPAAGDPAAVLGARRELETVVEEGLDGAAVLGARRNARTGDDSMMLIYLFILLATVCMIADRYTTARRMKQQKR